MAGPVVSATYQEVITQLGIPWSKGIHFTTICDACIVSSIVGSELHVGKLTSGGVSILVNALWI